VWDRRARVLKAHDGDTLTVVLDQGFGDTKQISGRLKGVYAPELKQPGGPETAEFTRLWILRRGVGQWPVIVTTIRIKDDTHEDMSFTRYMIVLTDLEGNELNTAVQQFVHEHGFGGGVGS
jgi:hypothetical protein